MFPVEFNKGSKALVVTGTEQAVLWHHRYGHLHSKGLKVLSTKEMVLGLPEVGEFEVCEGCLYGKQTRASFPTGKAWRASKILELLHADLCGPMSTSSLGGTKGLPDSFWSEAVATAVYVLNISPTRAVQDVTRFEAWRGKKPRVGHLRVFGCIAYALVNLRTKLEEKKFKESMMQQFEMTDLGRLKYFLGLEISQDESGIFMSQKKYATELLKKFNIRFEDGAKTPMNTGEKLQKEDGTGKGNEKEFRSLVGGLNYLTHSRPDIMYSVSMVSRFMHAPSKQHVGAAKRILKYIAGTLKKGVWSSSHDCPSADRDQPTTAESPTSPMTLTSHNQCPPIETAYHDSFDKGNHDVPPNFSMDTSSSFVNPPNLHVDTSNETHFLSSVAPLVPNHPMLARAKSGVVKPNPRFYSLDYVLTFEIIPKEPKTIKYALKHP
ncbi:hypothetical protein MRB53_002392 [Persea americana]|uniref:Uncharacterized protein n=1 Tax=Persea americana TaxID=3435 RepID=A0ACC2MUK1_PERAE|nr:hypothetical protein MRB53_002392 [Persea americana]